nr:UDP-N-acetylglucosamine 2-epimerase [uncultured Oscillibacter sp.]
MKHSVCAVTGSRAEFGLLRPLLARLEAESGIDLRLVVTGSHLSRSFGNTQDEIEAGGLTIHRRIPIPLEGDGKLDMAKAAGTALTRFAEYFSECRPELLVVLGDRYEIFAAAAAAAMLGVPIAHLHGGETTEGAADEFFRHAITKMSALHFTACETYRRRVIQLGEQPERVFNVGALGVENALNTPLMSLKELEESLEFPLEGRLFAVVTFHPVTLEDDTARAQMEELTGAMERFPEMRYIITLANADAGGREINRFWKAAAETHENWLVVPSLGVRRYLSALRYAAMMLGNSSSGIIEGPALGLPTVNVGDRQKGRLTAQSVICCEPERDGIQAAMEKALSEPFRLAARRTPCPFGDGRTSEKIASVILEFLESRRGSQKKKFYDIGF